MPSTGRSERVADVRHDRRRRAVRRVPPQRRQSRARGKLLGSFAGPAKSSPGLLSLKQTHSSLYQRGNFLKRMRLGQSLM